MRRFLLKLIVLSGGLALAILAFAAHAFCHQRQLLESIYTIKTGEHVLCIGASHIGASLVQMSNTCFKSLWLPCTDARGSLFIARLLELERRTQLKGITYCVIESSPIGYAEPLNKTYVANHFGYWLREFPVNWRYCEFKPFFDSDLKLGWELCKFVFGSPFKNVFAVPQGTDDAKRNARIQSYVTRPLRWREERLAHYLEHYKNYRSHRDAVQLRYETFRAMNEICKRHGIQMVVVTVPFLSTYRERLDPEAVARHGRFVKLMRDEGVWCFDRMNAFPDDLFFDPTHLNAAGALRFTAEFQAFIAQGGEK